MEYGLRFQGLILILIVILISRLGLRLRLRLGKRFKMHQPNTTVALTIAGSDSGGEAGIQADLNTFACLKVHGATRDHMLDGPKSGENFAIGTVPANHGPRAIGSHRGAFYLAAAKTGMLFSAAIVREVAHFFKRNPRDSTGG